MTYFFYGNEDPRQRAMRQRQNEMDGLSQGLTRMPQNVGQGLSSIGDALAYRHLQGLQQQDAADPWSHMRQPTNPSPIMKAIQGAWGKVFG